MGDRVTPGYTHPPPFLLRNNQEEPRVPGLMCCPVNQSLRVTDDICIHLTNQLRNNGACTTVQCTSPHRACTACVKQGGKISTHAQGSDLCDFHQERGAEAEKRRSGEMSDHLPYMATISPIQPSPRSVRTFPHRHSESGNVTMAQVDTAEPAIISIAMETTPAPMSPAPDQEGNMPEENPTTATPPTSEQVDSIEEEVAFNVPDGQVFRERLYAVLTDKGLVRKRSEVGPLIGFSESYFSNVRTRPAGSAATKADVRKWFNKHEIPLELLLIKKGQGDHPEHHSITTATSVPHLVVEPPSIDTGDTNANGEAVVPEPESSTNDHASSEPVAQRDVGETSQQATSTTVHGLLPTHLPVTSQLKTLELVVNNRRARQQLARVLGILDRMDPETLISLEMLLALKYKKNT